MSRKLAPVKVRDFRQFLKTVGCTYERTQGDHEIWSKPGLLRPVVFPTKDKEITTFFIRSNLRTLGLTDQEYFNLIQ